MQTSVGSFSLHQVSSAFAAACLIASLPSHALAQSVSDAQTSNPWFTSAQQTLQSKLNVQVGSSAKNVILFVGDGMSITTLTASRIRQGQLNGQSGEEGALSFENFPNTAIVKTYAVDAQTSASAATMTAMMSGVKTNTGLLGVSENAIREECQSMAGNEVVSVVELAELNGLATGIISTARITHATPAAAYAKTIERGWESISSIPDESIAQGCKDIAAQLIEFESSLEGRIDNSDVDGIDVVMGGGRAYFLPDNAAANSPEVTSGVEGNRTDGRNLIDEWQALYPQGQYVYDQAGFDQITSNTDKLLGLFNSSHMRYEMDRANDVAGEPSLSEMTSKAISMLSTNENGFLLVVEGGRIDHGHHAGNAYTALHETIELSDAVQRAFDETNPDETLIMVTADHSHVMTMAGSPKRGNPILGKVVPKGFSNPSQANDGLPYTTLGYMNGRGFADNGDGTNPDLNLSNPINAGRKDLNPFDATRSGFHQETLVPLPAETHAGEDIALHATGPGSSLVRGVIEQNVVFHIINRALGLLP